MRFLTSLTVSGEIPAARATCRSDRLGFSLIIRLAILRPSLPLRGRTRPSWPTRWPVAAVSADSHAADGRDGRRGDARHGRDHPVRPLRMRQDDPARGPLPVRHGQRQPVGDVRLHGEDEGVRLGPVEEADGDGVLTAELGGPQSMKPVDDPHGRAVYDDGR